MWVCDVIVHIFKTGAGSATGANVIEVSAGYDFESDPLCVTEVTVNNECLDSGNEIILSIDSDSLPAEVAVADGCGEARVEVFDDEGTEIMWRNFWCDMCSGTSTI